MTESLAGKSEIHGFFDGIDHATEEVLEFLKTPINAVDDGRAIFSAIQWDEDSLELANTADHFYGGLSGVGNPRPNFVWLCFEETDVGDLIRGAVLRRGWMDGKHGSKLRVSGCSRTRLLKWFRMASPQTLMDDEERAILGALPALIHAYRGAPGENAKEAGGGISWSLDQAVAEGFAKRAPYWVGKPAIVVEAQIPRDAVVAYFNERQESELVVNWRKVRDIQMVSRFAMPEDDRC